jgi:hypothetical protein
MTKAKQCRNLHHRLPGIALNAHQLEDLFPLIPPLLLLDLRLHFPENVEAQRNANGKTLALSPHSYKDLELHFKAFVKPCTSNPEQEKKLW